MNAPKKEQNKRMVTMEKKEQSKRREWVNIRKQK